MCPPAAGTPGRVVFSGAKSCALALPYTHGECRAKVAQKRASGGKNDFCPANFSPVARFPATFPCTAGGSAGKLRRGFSFRPAAPAERGFFDLNQTTNYQLSQWESTDRILMSDFNSDNSKIDAALGTLAQSRNCQAYFLSYRGNGSTSRAFTFPAKPLMVQIIGGGYWLCAAQGQSTGSIQRFDAEDGRNVPVEWTDSSVKLTLEDGYTNALYISNYSGTSYSLVAILDGRYQ